MGSKRRMPTTSKGPRHSIVQLRPHVQRLAALRLRYRRPTPERASDWFACIPLPTLPREFQYREHPRVPDVRILPGACRIVNTLPGSRSSGLPGRRDLHERRKAHNTEQRHTYREDVHRSTTQAGRISPGPQTTLAPVLMRVTQSARATSQGAGARSRPRTPARTR